MDLRVAQVSILRPGIAIPSVFYAFLFSARFSTVSNADFCSA
jgi:hypothetical protein